MNTKPILALVIGGIVGAAAAYFAFHPHTNPYVHPTITDEVHVHSDFIVSLNGVTWDFTAPKYQSEAGHELLEDMHLHDNDGHVMHRHAEHVTLADFFGSLGFTLTDDCITTDTGERYCSDDTNQLALFVNGEQQEKIATYVNQEEDQILLYYGDITDTAAITQLEAEITDRSCIYSGTCPERGVAEPENCGITCEL